MVCFIGAKDLLDIVVFVDSDCLPYPALVGNVVCLFLRYSGKDIGQLLRSRFDFWIASVFIDVHDPMIRSRPKPGKNDMRGIDRTDAIQYGASLFLYSEPKCLIGNGIGIRSTSLTLLTTSRSPEKRDQTSQKEAKERQNKTRKR